MTPPYEQVQIESRAEWRRWLAKHRARTPGIWLVTWKQPSGQPHVTYEDVVQEALAFGWIDSRPRKLDEQRSQLLVTPRKPASKWSRANKQRIGHLKASGRMAPAGAATVAAAEANGAWTALDDVENLVEPDDLSAALAGSGEARKHWDAFPRSAKRGILEWIGSARKPETRAKRVTETARLAGENMRAKQWRPGGG